MPSKKLVGIKQKKAKPQQTDVLKQSNDNKLNNLINQERKQQKIDPYLLKIHRIKKIELDTVFD